MCAAILLTLVAAAGVNYFMFHQNNTVPNNPSLAVYHADGVTPYASGADLTTDWVWTGTKFTLSLVIRNTGNTVLNTGLNTTMVPPTWNATILGNGTLNIGASQPVTIQLVPPSLIGGTSTGDYDLWIIG